MAIAPKANPANQLGNVIFEELGDDQLRIDLAVQPHRNRAGLDRDVAEQRQQAQQQGVRRQDRGVPSPGAAVLGAQGGGDAVRVHEQRQRRAQGERRVRPVLQRAGNEGSGGHGRVGRRRRGHLDLGRIEDPGPAAELQRQVDDGHRDHDVDQGVLDERDHGRRPQTGRVGVRGQHGEGDQQREVLGQQAVPAETDHLEHGLDADQLQRDVGHRGEDPGDGHGQAQAAGAVPALDDVRGGDVAVTVGHRPHPAEEEEDDRVEHDRVGHGEEAGHRAGRPHGRRHRNEGVRGVEVATEQEPGGDGAEALTAQTPFVQGVQVLRAPPLRGLKAHHGDDREQQDQDDQGHPVDVHHSPPRSGWLRR